MQDIYITNCQYLTYGSKLISYKGNWPTLKSPTMHLCKRFILTDSKSIRKGDRQKQFMIRESLLKTVGSVY